MSRLNEREEWPNIRTILAEKKDLAPARLEEVGKTEIDDQLDGTELIMSLEEAFQVKLDF